MNDKVHNNASGKGSLDEIGEKLRLIAERVARGDFSQVDVADRLLWDGFRTGTLLGFPVVHHAVDRVCRLAFSGGIDDLPYGITESVLSHWGPAAIPGFPVEMSGRGGEQSRWFSTGLRELAIVLEAGADGAVTVSAGDATPVWSEAATLATWAKRLGRKERTLMTWAKDGSNRIQYVAKGSWRVNTRDPLYEDWIARSGQKKKDEHAAD